MFADEYYFKEGCFIQEWHNSPDDQATKLHALINTTERYILLQGRASVTVAHKTWDVGAGDVVDIAPGQAQAIRNLADEDLLFLAVCTPRFDLKNYQELQP